MKIFLDSANVNDIKEMVELKLIDGITTNPTLLAREGGDFMNVLKEIVTIVNGPVNVEPVSPTVEGIFEEAKEFAKIGDNIVIKIPFTEEGIKAANGLLKGGVRVSFTLVFSVNQAILAAKIGADYVIPFVGRLDDSGQCGMDIVRDIVKIYKNYNFKTLVLAASIRTTQHIVDAALCGADIVTIPKAVIEQMIKHPLTDAGIKKFIEDWEKRNHI